MIGQNSEYTEDSTYCLPNREFVSFPNVKCMGFDPNHYGKQTRVVGTLGLPLAPLVFLVENY